MNRYTDFELCGKYVAKADLCLRSNIEFSLSFSQFKQIMNAKKCRYTGKEMTKKRAGKNMRATDVTIDRINPNLGYVTGNVCACCNAANNIKSVIESPDSIITPKDVKKIADVLIKGKF